MSAEAPPLPADLVAGLRRLKLATIRTQAPEILQIARTQRWPPRTRATHCRCPPWSSLSRSCSGRDRRTSPPAARSRWPWTWTAWARGRTLAWLGAAAVIGVVWAVVAAVTALVAAVSAAVSAVTVWLSTWDIGHAISDRDITLALYFDAKYAEWQPAKPRKSS